MTPAELDALIEQFPEIHPGNYGEDDAIALNNWGIDAVAALVQLRAEVAMEKAFSDIELQTCIELRARAERADAEVARLKDAPIRILQLETERDALKAERADLIKINNKWAGEWDAMREQVEEMRKVIEAAKANRETLSEIAGSKSLTATPTQFYQHLQRIAAKATAGPFDDLLAALDKEQK